MVDNVEIAHGMNRLNIPDGLVVRTQDIASFPPEKLVVLVSGSQAEPMSSLSRVAVDTHRLLTLDERDTVILSARIIPGNEKAIFRMLDHMFRKRALVYYDNDGGTIHVSGHASQEEQKLLLNLVRPRYFIPIHGEYRQLFRHAALAHTVGVVSGEILLIEDGQPIEFTDDAAYRREPVTAGRVCVDSGSLEEIEEFVIRDRQHLSEDGVVVPIIAIDKHTGTDRISAGNRDARISAVGKWPGIAGRGARGHSPHRGAIESRRKDRLERHQGKNSRGPAALPQETNFQAPSDPSRDSRIVRLAAWLSSAIRLRPYQPADFETLYRIDQACFPKGHRLRACRAEKLSSARRARTACSRKSPAKSRDLS